MSSVRRYRPASHASSGVQPEGSPLALRPRLARGDRPAHSCRPFRHRRTPRRSETENTMDLSLLISQWSGKLPEGFVRPTSLQTGLAECAHKRCRIKVAIKRDGTTAPHGAPQDVKGDRHRRLREPLTGRDAPTDSQASVECESLSYTQSNRLPPTRSRRGCQHWQRQHSACLSDLADSINPRSHDYFHTAASMSGPAPLAQPTTVPDTSSDWRPTRSRGTHLAAIEPPSSTSVPSFRLMWRKPSAR